MHRYATQRQTPDVMRARCSPPNHGPMRGLEPGSQIFTLLQEGRPMVADTSLCPWLDECDASGTATSGMPHAPTSFSTPLCFRPQSQNLELSRLLPVCRASLLSCNNAQCSALHAYRFLCQRYYCRKVYPQHTKNGAFVQHHKHC